MVQRSERGHYFVKGKKLSSEQRTAIIICHLEGKDVATIMNELQLDRKTVKKYIGKYENDEDEPKLYLTLYCFCHYAVTALVCQKLSLRCHCAVKKQGYFLENDNNKIYQ